MTRHRPPCRIPTARQTSLALALCLSIIAVTPLQAQGAAPTAVRLPSLGEAASDDFNLNQEKRIGEQIMRGIPWPGACSRVLWDSRPCRVARSRTTPL